MGASYFLLVDIHGVLELVFLECLELDTVPLVDSTLFWLGVSGIISTPVRAFKRHRIASLHVRQQMYNCLSNLSSYYNF